MKRILIVAVLLLAGCGGGGGDKARVDVGEFQRPSLTCDALFTEGAVIPKAVTEGCLNGHGNIEHAAVGATEA